MAEYPVRLIYPVVLDNGEVLAFARAYALPFVPFPGLELRADWSEQFPLLVDRVTWDDKNRSFEVVFNPVEWSGPSADEVLLAQQNAGWQIDPEAAAALQSDEGGCGPDCADHDHDHDDEPPSRGRRR